MGEIEQLFLFANNSCMIESRVKFFSSCVLTIFFSCFIMVIFVVLVVFFNFFFRFSVLFFFGFTALMLVHFPAYVGFLKVEVACL